MGLLTKSKGGAAVRTEPFTLTLETAAVRTEQARLDKLADALGQIDRQIAGCEQQRQALADEAVGRLAVELDRSPDADLSAWISRETDGSELGAELQRREAELQGRLVALKAKRAALTRAIDAQRVPLEQARIDAKRDAYDQAAAAHRQAVRGIARAVFHLIRSSQQEVAVRDALSSLPNAGHLSYMAFMPLEDILGYRTSGPIYGFLRDAVDGGYITADERERLELND